MKSVKIGGKSERKIDNIQRKPIKNVYIDSTL